MRKNKMRELQIMEQIQTFGITANLTILDTPLGPLKEIDIVCGDKAKVELLIEGASKMHIAHERNDNGVKFYMD